MTQERSQVPGLALEDGASGRNLIESRALKIFRFFETESIAVIAMIASKYRIEVKEEPEFAGETFEARYARLTAVDKGLTILYVMYASSWPV